MNTKIIIMIVVVAILAVLLQFCVNVHAPLNVESKPINTSVCTPTLIITPAPVAPTPSPTTKFVGHADGDPRKCGTCHTYPSFDEDNNPYKIDSMAIPTSTKEKDPFVKSMSNSPIPSDYYSHDCKLPTDQSMQEYLANSEWVDDYEINAWDCSQMAAYMEFMLENCGYHVVIRAAEVEGEEYGHAWILV